MSFLDQLNAKKRDLKKTVTNITYADGSQEEVELSKCGDESSQTQRVQLKPKAYGFIVDTKPDFVPACILEDFLYLGSQDAVMQENVIKYNLTNILSVGIDTPASDIAYDGQVSAHFVECLDLPDTRLDLIIKQTNEIIKSVLDKNGRVLVHCNAGVSRSSAVCIGYLMLELGLTFDSAYGQVKSKRECIRPNDGFLKQLKEMERMTVL